MSYKHLIKAIKEINPDEVERLLLLGDKEHGRPLPNFWKGRDLMKAVTPLFLATATKAPKKEREKRCRIVTLLLLAGADPNMPIHRKSGDLTPLALAAQTGNRQIAELLLLAGGWSDVPNQKNETPLDGANKKSYNEIVNMMKLAKLGEQRKPFHCKKPKGNE